MVAGSPAGLRVPAAVRGAAADVGDPPAAAVLTGGCPALGVGRPGWKWKSIPIFATVFWGLPLVATEVSGIFAEGGSLFPGRPKERSTCRKKISWASLELQSSSGTSVNVSMAIVSTSAVAPSGKYRETSYKPIFNRNWC